MHQRFYSILAPLFALILSPLLQSAEKELPLNHTPSPGEYQSPDQTAANMKLPDGFQVQVFAGEPDVYQPIGYCFDARGRLWVLENYSYPDWAEEGHDRVVIFTDKDGDGRFDERKLFWDKGNFASGIQVGYGGVWIGSPPHLLFIPDRDGDDVPDGEAEKLLDGWGHHDTHETINSFVWGPDQWLYGCQGVFTRSKVGKPGSADAERIPVNACIWRYHPTRHEFEVFAEGGSNQWGVDFNDQGQAFMTCCVIPHLFHVVQGGRYTRQAGQHNSPFIYEDITTIRTHKHFASAFAGAMIYLGDNFPAEYRNQIFMNNIHANKIHADWLAPKGSSYVGSFGPHDRSPADGDRGTGFMNSGDKWYRGLCLRTGPDGGVFVCDWYDRLPCHQVRPHDRSNGRIYKFTYGDAKRITDIDLPASSDAELVALQLHENDWWVRHARRVLSERAASGKDMTGTQAALRSLLSAQTDETRRLRALWALHTTGGLDESLTLELLDDSQEYVRAWVIQFELEDRAVSPAVHQRLVALAEHDSSPIVRLYLAAACQRMDAAHSWPIVEQLAKHGEDAEDHNLPQMYWYAIEPLVAQDRTRGIKLAASAKIPKLRQFIARRIAAGE